MIGISPTVAFVVLLALGIVLFAMIGVIYSLLGKLPRSHSDDPQLFPLKNGTPDRHRIVPSNANRVISAILIGVIWFSLWVMFTRITENRLLEGASLHLAKAFGYATAMLAGALATMWCGVYLWSRRRKN